MVTAEMKKAMIDFREAASALSEAWDEKGYNNSLYPFDEDFGTMILKINEWIASNIARTLWDQFLLETGNEDNDSPELLAQYEKWAPFVVTTEYDEEENFFSYMLYYDGKKHRAKEEIIFRSVDVESARHYIYACRMEAEHNAR